MKNVIITQTKTITPLSYRELLLWLERRAEEVEDGELDMPVVLAVGGGSKIVAAALVRIEQDDKKLMLIGNGFA